MGLRRPHDHDAADLAPHHGVTRPSPPPTAPVPEAPVAERNRALLGWYADSGRTLPWRGAGDPYRILVSEVMLQQTQVDRVIPYYERFLDVFPTVHALAGAALADVLTAWSGLGYNNRAERLHRAARAVVADGWPKDVAGFAALPGVGAYTARALAAFWLGHDVVPVDTNLRRVLSRWHGEPLDGAVLERAADEARGSGPAADWSQAVMDLGSAVCTARRPRCDECPVAAWCCGPGISVPVRPQARFEGSVRQLRGAIVRRLTDGPATAPSLARHTAFDEQAVRLALEQLEREGMVESAGPEAYRLPD